MKSTVFVACLMISAGCSNAPTTADMATGGDASAPDLSAPPDLTAAPDLTPAGPDMTSCGNAALGGPQLPNISAACTACGAASCCSQLAACSADAECVALRQCYAACAFDDTACTKACQTAHPTAVSTTGAAVSTCRNTNCAAQCANTACAGAVSWPQPATQTYTFTLTVDDYQSGAAIAGAALKVCGLADGACANPLSTATTAANGSAQLTTPSAPGTVGAYIEVDAAGYETTLDYIYQPTDVALDGGSFTVVLLSNGLFGTFATLVLGGAADPTRGAVVFEVDQCVSATLPGASVAASTADAKTKEAYIAGGLPSTTATMTDSSGTGGFFNLPVGMATLTTTFNNAKYGSVQVQVRAGAVTALNLVPTP